MTLISGMTSSPTIEKSGATATVADPEDGFICSNQNETVVATFRVGSISTSSKKSSLRRGMLTVTTLSDGETSAALCRIDSSIFTSAQEAECCNCIGGPDPECRRRVLEHVAQCRCDRYRIADCALVDEKQHRVQIEEMLVLGLKDQRLCEQLVDNRVELAWQAMSPLKIA